MRLYTWEGDNFGDLMNGWLWPRVAPGLLDDDERTLFVGIGSLLNARVPVEPVKVVLGAGVGYGRPLRGLDGRWRVYCVRGPLSAAGLGLPKDAAVTDAAVLIRRVPLNPVSARYPVAYMPHWRSEEYWDWESLCTSAEIKYISPRGAFEVTLDRVRGTQLLITEAMHGAIVADALRIPWIPVRAYKHVHEFKWRDWCASLGIAYEPTRLLPLYGREPATVQLRARLASRRDGKLRRAGLHAAALGLALNRDRVTQRMAVENARRLAALARRPRPQLSSETAVDGAADRLQHCLENLRQDRARGSVGASAFAAATSAPRLDAAGG